MIERVARAIFAQEHGSEDEFEEYAGPYIQAAYAAIAVVVEECARVCEELRRANYSGETEDWIDGTNDCVTAIRALAAAQEDGNE